MFMKTVPKRGVPSSDTRDLLSALTEVSRSAQSAALCAVCLCCDSVVMSIRRIMHWARRIEQEIDRVFQHITGAQQLKGVSVCLSFYSTRVLLTIVCCVNSMSSASVAVCTMQNESSAPSECSHVAANNYSTFLLFSHRSRAKNKEHNVSLVSSSGRHKTRIAFLRLSPARFCFFDPSLLFVEPFVLFAMIITYTHC